MIHDMKNAQAEARENVRGRRRRLAWILILLVDVGFVAWGAMAAVMPDGLFGPGGKAILPAGYEGYSGGHGRSFCARLR